MTTLWDLIQPVLPGRRPKPDAAPARKAGPAARPAPPAGREPARTRPTMRDRYEQITREMLREHGVRVRKWRSSMSGVAWQVTYSDGNVSRLIESPRPRGPMSMAIFLHEIGHHVIGFGVHRPRCLEEYHAWMFALGEMERRGLNVTAGVRKRVRESLMYAVQKGQRRGLRSVPPEVAAYLATEAAADRSDVKGG